MSQSGIGVSVIGRRWRGWRGAQAAHIASMEKLTVYYDGACPVCSREIAAYQRARGAEAIEFVDAAACPAPALGEGLTREAALAAMHARRPDGSLVQGARAFGEIWGRLPDTRPLGALMRVPGVAWVAELAYRGFLRVRRAWRR
jgi:3-demethoxyubiquinol 3-hydroxylase